MQRPAPFSSYGRSNRDNGRNPGNSLRANLGTVAPYMPGVFPHQPRSIVQPTWTQPEMRAFGSDQNRAYLKKEVLRRFRGAISDPILVEVMAENVSYYLFKYMDETYGATDWAQIQGIVQMLNERTLRRIGQLYAAERAVTSQWMQLQHQPSYMNSAMPRVERTGMLADYDREMTL